MCFRCFQNLEESYTRTTDRTSVVTVPRSTPISNSTSPRRSANSDFVLRTIRTILCEQGCERLRPPELYVRHLFPRTSPGHFDVANLSNEDRRTLSRPLGRLNQADGKDSTPLDSTACQVKFRLFSPSSSVLEFRGFAAEARYETARGETSTKFPQYEAVAWLWRAHPCPFFDSILPTQ